MGRLLQADHELEPLQRIQVLPQMRGETQLNIDVSKCGHCPFVQYIREHGASYYVCGHPGEKPGADLYATVQTEEVPHWCPIRKNVVTIRIEAK